eukprot:CAMPEP_0183726458 /NCGR_PEP_ID=MMETSP0737-20130205/23243_1 /TAXON_ID=385413 /ORGANISM="Thalassiosira miniscula, Strain CCMP1093" /LENGTH=281 /DNA_ID=CAMNT_0025957799 /DNA_START=128 /DNA_END=973 /DNA_ORIENTATION=+
MPSPDEETETTATAPEAAAAETTTPLVNTPFADGLTRVPPPPVPNLPPSEEADAANSPPPSALPSSTPVTVADPTANTCTPVPTTTTTTDDGELRLLKPDNIRSRFWTHFMKYDTDFHPDKKNTARCSLCGKDISVKQGTGGLKNHMKFKHPEENIILFESDTLIPMDGMLRGSSSSSPPRKKARGVASFYEERTMRLDAEKRLQEKHWMEMWTLSRRELRTLRAELKEEDDEEARRELEGDIAVIKKRKAEYAAMLGHKEEDGAVVTPSDAAFSAVSEEV